MKTIVSFFCIQLFSIICFSQKDYGDEYPIDTITFEEPCFYLKIDTSATNIWQIGQPQKFFFNQSFSLPNAIVTDTLNNYPLNNYSYFDLIIDENSFPSYAWQMFFEFKHKVNSDTLRDGGYITISYDKGQTFNNIINETEQNYFVTPTNNNGWFDEYKLNMYNEQDTLFNGEFGFSGKTEWITTKFAWYNIPCKNVQNKIILDTIFIRFNFISDNINNIKDGWMIDNIRLYKVDLGGDIKTLSNPKHSVIQTNPIKDKSLIIFDKKYKNIVLEVYNIIGKNFRTELIRNKKRYIFYKNTLPKGIYFIKLYYNNKFSETHKIIISN